jgi:dethiobiotin synthetase
MGHMAQNIEAIAARIGAPLLGHVPRLDHPTAAAAAACLNLSLLEVNRV